MIFKCHKEQMERCNFPIFARRVLEEKNAPEKISIYLFSARLQNVFSLSSNFNQPAWKLAFSRCGSKLNFTVARKVLLPFFQEHDET